MTQISWLDRKILWVYGPQAGLTLLFGNWRFWWFCLRHPLGLCHGVSHCSTSTMTYSRTLFLLIVEKQIWIEIERPYHHSTKRHWWMISHSVSTVSITFFRKLINVILLWTCFCYCSKFSIIFFEKNENLG